MASTEEDIEITNVISIEYLREDHPSLWRKPVKMYDTISCYPEKLSVKRIIVTGRFC